jgi:outer membrane receptor protein involved in Fe transport
MINQGKQPTAKVQQPTSDAGCGAREFIGCSMFRRVTISVSLRIFALLLLLAGTVHAQENGSVSGVVVSTWDATPLPGVTVTVRGTTLAAQAGADGRFELKNVPPGEQVLRFSKSGYATATVTEVRVLPGQTTTVNGNLRPEFYDLEEYEVTAEEFNEQSEKIIVERQQSSSMMDAVGSDSFKNLAVGDAAGALSKVTGATVADGKYAVIRGLADRYTFTTLNGMELPSADPDRKAFQLDLMPSKFIEKLDVRKTFTPDMSGGFAGGSIDIVTKSFPDDFLFEFRVGTAYNTEASLRKNFLSSNHGGNDWLGMDDGTRALPPAAALSSPNGTQFLPDSVKNSFAGGQFAPTPMKSPLNADMSMLIGDSKKFDSLGGIKLGFLAGINYKNEYEFYDDGIVRSYDSGGQQIKIDKTDTRGVIHYQWGALASLSMELNEQHSFRFNYMYIQSADDEARHLQGQDGDVTSASDGTYTDQSILRWTERNLAYYQVSGGHDFPELDDIRLDWGAAYSETTQDDPDYRIFQFIADPQNDFYNANYSSSKPSYPTRYWRALAEKNQNYRVDLTVPVPSYNAKDNSIKTGVAYSESKRDYSQRGFSFLGNSGHPFFSSGDPNTWLNEDYLQYIRVRNFPANLEYNGRQIIEGAYLMGDWNTFECLELIGGARYENTSLSIDSFNVTKNTANPSGSINQNDVLPSVTAILRLGEHVDIRAAWSDTVVRPTYREIAKVEIYDVSQNRTYIGNPDLKISDCQNFDLRASWYPRPGEILSASAFAKRIKDPIEQASLDRDNAQISYENFEKADVFGVEAEARFKLDRLWDEFEPFSVGVNGAYIKSKVPLTESQIKNRGPALGYGDRSTTRPLYNQPKYIFNADVTWDFKRTGTAVTLSGGMVGESLVLVGLAKPDEYVQPAPQLNLFIRQKLSKNWDLRFTAKNLLNPAYEVTQTWPEVGKVVLRSYTKGITFGLSLGCEF